MLFSKHQRVTNIKLLEFTKKRPCIVCGKNPCDPCHIRSRGSGGPDEAFNIIPMCRLHHIEQHQVGFIKMMSKYNSFRKQLHDMGWQLISVNGKLKLYHPELDSLQ